MKKLLFALVVPLVACGGDRADLGSSSPAPAGSSAAALSGSAPPLVVSITFDDGYAEISRAASMLEARGMRGTFFIISGWLGTAGTPVPGYVTLDQLRAMQAAGHEIGGHTVSHPHLPALPADDAQRQICNDRANLINYGLDVRTLAYPYGERSASVEALAAACGYDAARAVGPLNQDPTAPKAETIPPQDLYAIRTPWSVQSSQPLADIEKWVTDAEVVGGWLPIVFHHLCDAAPCDQYAIATADFAAFLDWLAARPGTTVKRIRDVAGGPLQPLVMLPNPVLNPSLESATKATDGTPDYWQHTGGGVNTATWTRTADAHTGAFAQRLDITSFSSGFQRLLPIQRSASPPATPGHAYRLTAWYRSSLQPMWTLYYRDATGAWNWWTQSPSLPVSGSWTQAAFDTPPVPPGATAIDFGLSAFSTGFLVMDDFGMEDRGLAPPASSISEPVEGASVEGTATVTASATGFAVVDHVDFLANGVLVGTARAAPYSIAWDTRTVADGLAALSATVYDGAGSSVSAPAIHVYVTNYAGRVQNPSLESDVGPHDGVPDCWQAVGFGTNDASFAMTGDAHAGTFAEAITISSFTSGGARLLPALDSGKCAPAGTPGKTYTVTGWYRPSSTAVKAQWVAFYRDQTGAWIQWSHSANLPAASSWTGSSWTTPALPPGATNLTVGLTLYSAGTLTVDDFTLFQNP